MTRNNKKGRYYDRLSILLPTQFSIIPQTAKKHDGKTKIRPQTSFHTSRGMLKSRTEKKMQINLDSVDKIVSDNPASAKVETPTYKTRKTPIYVAPIHIPVLKLSEASRSTLMSNDKFVDTNVRPLSVLSMRPPLLKSLDIDGKVPLAGASEPYDSTPVSPKRKLAETLLRTSDTAREVPMITRDEYSESTPVSLKRKISGTLSRVSDASKESSSSIIDKQPENTNVTLKRRASETRSTECLKSDFVLEKYNPDDYSVGSSGYSSARSDIPQAIDFKGMERTSSFPYIPPLATDLSELIGIVDSPPQSISPYTYTEQVIDLCDEEFEQFVEEDHLFLKSVIEGHKFTTDQVHSLFTSLSDNQYIIISKIVVYQYFKMAKISNLVSDFCLCPTVAEFSTKLEASCVELFDTRSAILMIDVNSANIFVNHPRLLIYPHGVGFVGTAFGEKKQIVAPNPLKSHVFDEMYDLPFCEDAEMIIVQPIIDPDDDKCYGVILMIDKIHKSGANFLYWPQSEMCLLKYFSDQLWRVFRRFKREIDQSSSLMLRMTKFISKQHSIPRLVGIFRDSLIKSINCVGVSIFVKIDDLVHLIEYKDQDVVIRAIPAEKVGICSECFKGNDVNCRNASEHANYSKLTDSEFRESCVICSPLVIDGENVGAVAARGKTNDVCFTQTDINNLKILCTAFVQPLLSAIKNQRKVNELRSAIKAQDKLISLLKTAESLASDMNLDSLIEKIIENSTKLVDADRGTLYITDGSRTHLISKVAQGTGSFMIPIDTGLAGTVASTGKVINIDDVYRDSRFNSSIDKKTGYRTKSLMTLPVFDQKKDIIAVVQLINKLNGGSFTERDIEMAKAMLVFTGIALSNARMIENALDTTNQINALFKTINMLILESQGSLMMLNILTTLRNLIYADRCTLFVVNGDEIISSLAEGENTTIKVEKGKGIVGITAVTGETMNIPDAYSDSRFNCEIDKMTGYKTRSILSTPVFNYENEIVAVIEFINKDIVKNSGVFSAEDEALVSAFTSLLSYAFDREKSREDNELNVGVQFANLLTSEEEKQMNPVSAMLISSDIQILIQECKFDSRDISNLTSLKLCVYIIWKLGLVEYLGYSNGQTVQVLLKVHDNLSRDAWLETVNSLHTLFLLLTTTSLHEFFTQQEICAITIAVLGLRLGRVEYPNQQRDTALEIIFNTSSINEITVCEKIVETILIEKNQPDVFWKTLFDCVLSTDTKNHFEIIYSARLLLFPKNMLNPSKHKSVVAKLIMKAVMFSIGLKHSDTFEEWVTRCNFSPKEVVAYINFMILPVFTCLQKIDENLSSMINQIDSNLSNWIEKC